MRRALKRRLNSLRDVKALAVKFFRKMHMCHCDEDITKLMHATFRRDRKRHYRPFILMPPSDAEDEMPDFVELRANFMNTLLDHFMLNKYHKQDRCELEVQL